MGLRDAEGLRWKAGICSASVVVVLHVCYQLAPSLLFYRPTNVRSFRYFLSLFLTLTFNLLYIIMFFACFIRISWVRVQWHLRMMGKESASMFYTHPCCRLNAPLRVLPGIQSRRRFTCRILQAHLSSFPKRCEDLKEAILNNFRIAEFK
jgi:hypothetical protein